MKIETKHNLGDELFFMNNNKIDNHIITGINITTDQSFIGGEHINIGITYVFGNTRVFEDYCFKTKEELLNSL